MEENHGHASIALLPAYDGGSLASDRSTADSLDQYLNILQSVQLPLRCLPYLSSPRPATHGRFVNTLWMTVLGWSLSFLFITTNFYLVFDFLMDPNAPILTRSVLLSSSISATDTCLHLLSHLR